MKLSREMKIGLLVTTAIACFIWGFNFLKGKDLFTLRTQYYAIYDNVDGLVTSNPVMINGMAVGKVNKVFFHPDHSGRLVVHIIMNNTELPLPKNTVAAIVSTGLLGGKAVELKLGNATEVAQSEDTLMSILDRGFMAQLDPIKGKAESLMSSVDSVLAIVYDVRKDVYRAVKSFSNSAATIDGMLAEERIRLNKIMANVESITGNLEKNNAKLSNIMSNFSSISDSLAKANLLTTIENANKALKETSDIVQKINSGKGTIGMLINNEGLYKNLESTSKNLDLLVEDLRLHPKRYVHISVFGKKEKAYKEEKKK